MNEIDNFLEEISDNHPDEDLLYPTDLKDAIIGSVEHITLGEVLLLDKDKCIQIFCERDGMTPEEAIEHFEYNVIGSYIDGVPAYATLIENNTPHKCACGGNCNKHGG